MEDKKYSNDDVKTLFRRYDELDKKVSAIESHLNTETGFRPSPESPITQGYIWKSIEKLDHSVFGNGNMGLKTKMFLVFWVFPSVFTLLGSFVTKIIMDYLE